MARLAYPDPSDVAELMRRFPPPVRHMNIGRMVSHAPTLVAPYYNSYAAVAQSLELDPQLRQLAILRVAERASAEYLLVEHRALAKLVGLTDQQISAARPADLDSTSYWSDPTCYSRVQTICRAGSLAGRDAHTWVGAAGGSCDVDRSSIRGPFRSGEVGLRRRSDDERILRSGARPHSGRPTSLQPPCRGPPT